MVTQQSCRFKIVFVALACISFACAAEKSASLEIDCAKITGEIRPLHGGNCGPIQFGELVDLSAYFKSLKIPYSRLHDCHWPNPDVVDIHTIFPNFDADPKLPESYDFRRTDDYIQATLNTGSKIVYRLGESIEHTKRKYHVHPPRDFAKWAEICAGIIAHYNEGWAGGAKHGIVYWEIWNEPENQPAMWTGKDEDYFWLYETAAKALKSRWPELKIGGPSLGYTGKIVRGKFEPGEFAVRFLDRCKEKSIPLDFFSWHLYTADPSECLIRARGLREALDARGFKTTELHFNEWNFLPGNDWTALTLKGQGLPRERFFQQVGGAAGAAFVASVLINLQDSPVDVANYYLSDSNGLGLFTVDGVPKKNYCAMKAFSQLLDTPQRLEARGGDAKGLNLCAGIDKEKMAVGVLFGNLQSPVKIATVALKNLPWTGPSRFELVRVNAESNLETIKTGELGAGELTLELDTAPPTVLFLKVSTGGDARK